MSDQTTTDTSSSTQSGPSTRIILIIVFVLIAVIGVAVRIALCIRRDRKREKKEAEMKKAGAGNSGPASPPSDHLAEQGLTGKPELEGSAVGGVIRKMELDSTPVAELDSSRPVRELDGSGTAARLGRRDPDPDAITPAPEIRTTGVWERWG
ncbi:hypothetical protein F5Y05DRAFT_176907 [Hypoxylon sp. FL0543]|nr:hypothetical protein F5Y05DRAFT_176907 [Hypoxylon sp. FL0543]